MEDQLAERLQAELASRPLDRPGVDGAAIVAVVFSVIVYLVPIGLVGLAAWLVYAAWRYPVAWIGIVLLLGIAFVIRPRIHRLDPDAHLIKRSAAPALYELVDRLCDELGAPRVHAIEVSTEFNAAAGVYGRRRRRVLLIGLPLWNMLSRQQRVVVLGHELGHFINGDPARTGFVGRALGTLGSLDGLLRADAPGVAPHFGETVAQFLMWLLSLPVRAVGTVIALVTFRSMQRAEYLADQLASRLGGTDANVSALELQLLIRSAGNHLIAEARRVGKRDLWEAGRRYVAEFPALEKERLLRAAARARSRADDTHPPTYLRMKLASLPERRTPAAYVLGQGEAEAIEIELKPWYDKLEKQIRAELLGAEYP